MLGWAQPAGAQQTEPTAPPPPPQSAPAEKPLTISADRPGFGDGTGIAPIGHFQLELGYQFTFSDRNDVESQTHDAPQTLARVGIIDDRLELRVGTVGYEYNRTDSGSGFETESGFNDVRVGAKVKLWDQDNYLPCVALVASTTLGLGSKNISDREVEPSLEVAWSLAVAGGFNVGGSGSVIYSSTDGDRFVQGAGSVLVGYTISDNIGAFAEYFLISPIAKGSGTAHYVDFGVTYLLTNHTQLDGTVGFGLNDESDNFFVGGGVSFLF
jgi:hypothetical protein